MKGIDVRPNGKFRVRVAMAGKRLTKHFESEAAAVTFLNALKSELAAGDIVPVEGMSLIDLRNVFLAERKTLRNYPTDCQRFDTHLMTAPFAAQAVQTVTRVQVIDWLSDLETKTTAHRYRPNVPLSRQTRKHCLNLLRAFFTLCQDRGLVALNPCLNLRMKGMAPATPDNWYLTPEEQQRVSSVQHPEIALVLFAMGTGLRQGEQWSLHLRDVHADAEQPHVYVRFGSEGKPPKNGKPRIVPLFGMGLAAARAWLATLPSYASHNPKGLMFPTRRGAHRGKSKIPVEVWTEVKAALGRHVHWHLLRHTTASSLVAGWWGRRWRLEEAKDMMGHSSITVTQRYAHLATSRLLEVAGEAHVNWSEMVPSAEKLGQNEDSLGLRSRMSGVRIPPGAQGVSGVSQDQAGTNSVDAESSAIPGFGIWTEEGQ